MSLTTAPVRFGVALNRKRTPTNEPNTVVQRDADGDFAANMIEADLTGDVTGNVTGNLTGNVTGNVTGAVTGNASTATTLQTARNLSLTGDVTATLSSFNGSANVSAAATIAGGAVTASKLGSDVFQCRAWVSFDGDSVSTTCTILGSGNVSSVTRTGTGKFTVTMTNALSSAAYAVVGMVEADSDDTQRLSIGLQAGTTPTTSSFQILTGQGNTNTKRNYNPTMVAVFR
jgi:trimeric autotransporter adhesin